MGRTNSNSNLNSDRLRIEIKTPSLFRCPISLEVMRSPVSLCTGVTYERTSIQRWIDSGNATCPATMIPLSSTVLVPNLTLRRLINIWSSVRTAGDNSSSSYAPADLIQQIPSSSNPLPLIRQLAAFFRDSDIDDTVKNGVINATEFAPVVVRLLTSSSSSSSSSSAEFLDLDVVDAAVEIVSLVLGLDCIDEGSKKNRVVSALREDLDSTLSALISVLVRSDESSSSRLEAKVNSARILGFIVSAIEPRRCSLNSEHMDLMVGGLVNLIGVATDEAIGCLMELLSLPSKGPLRKMVELGVVPALLRVLSPNSSSVDLSPKTAGRAILILDAVSNFGMGRAAIDQVLGECVKVVMSRMMKVGKEGREAAVGLLWSVCYNCGGEKSRRGKEAVAGVSGGMAKMLVVMQGDCSPGERMMAADLLRVFRAEDAKSLLAGYDTKTTHIMPF